MSTRRGLLARLTSSQTTLIAIIAKHLKKHFEAEEYPIVTLQIKEDVLDHQIDLVEDLLDAVYRALEEARIPQSDSALQSYANYRRERYSVKTEGCRRRERLTHLRKAVHAMTSGSSDFRAYLILDGIDRCGSTIRFLLETELDELQTRGVSILLTSRLAVFENDEATCDLNSLPEEMRQTLSLYMECRVCESEHTVACLPCIEAGKTCRKW